MDLLAGQVKVMAPNLLTALPHIKAGRLRALAVTSAKRSEALPDIPTIAEAGVPGCRESSAVRSRFPATTRGTEGS